MVGCKHWPLLRSYVVVQMSNDGGSDQERSMELVKSVRFWMYCEDKVCSFEDKVIRIWGQFRYVVWGKKVLSSQEKSIIVHWGEMGRWTLIIKTFLRWFQKGSRGYYSDPIGASFRIVNDNNVYRKAFFLDGKRSSKCSHFPTLTRFPIKSV